MKCHCFLNLQGILYTVVNFLGSRREVEMLTLDDNSLNGCFWRKFKCSVTQLSGSTFSKDAKFSRRQKKKMTCILFNARYFDKPFVRHNI